MPDNKIELYVVVCTDLHASRGPYPNLPMALEMARALTRTGSCVFLPVPLVWEGEIVHEDADVQSEERTFGQYL